MTCHHLANCLISACALRLLVDSQGHAKGMPQQSLGCAGLMGCEPSYRMGRTCLCALHSIRDMTCKRGLAQCVQPSTECPQASKAGLQASPLLAPLDLCTLCCCGATRWGAQILQPACPPAWGDGLLWTVPLHCCLDQPGRGQRWGRLALKGGRWVGAGGSWWQLVSRWQQVAAGGAGR